MGHSAEMIAYLLFVAVSALVLGAAVGILLTRAARHVGWWIGRQLDARGRRGDVLEALAREIEDRS